MLQRIVSGGQTGVDRGALDAALEMGFPCGGWCPANRKAEDGRILDHYPLVELPQGGYLQRTKRNVMDSDGTLIVYFKNIEGGTLQTLRACEGYRKPHLRIDASNISVERAVHLLGIFALDCGIQKLNVAGPRKSRAEVAYQFAHDVVRGIIIQRRSSS